MDGMTEHQIKLKVFQTLCRHDNDIMSGWVPLPTTVIAPSLGISLYQCRKAMKKLVEEGLAVKDSCVLDLEDSFLPYNGFAITNKGKETGIYMYEALHSARICSECFGGKITSFLPKGFDMRWLHRDEVPTKEQAKILDEISLILEECVC